LAYLAFELSNFLFEAFFGGWLIIKFAQLISLLSLFYHRVGDRVFSARSGSGGTTTEDLF
jgi:hypothetical protein